MTAFNPRHLAREIPALTWRAYLTSRSVAIPEALRPYMNGLETIGGS